MRERRLQPGDRLPTVRDLAVRLGVSPATVAAGYRDLQLRGLIEGRGRLGTQVTPQPPVGGRFRSRIPAGLRDLASGNPDPDLLPDWSEAMDRLPRRSPLYGATDPDPDLLEIAAARMKADGVDAQHLTVVNGALDGLERVLSAHLRPGDSVAVEDPSYPAMLDLLRTLGMRPVPVAVDDLGAKPEALEKALGGGARGLLLTPRCQNPYGAALDLGRRRELRSVLRANRDVLVVEDDHADTVGGGSVIDVVERGWAAWAVVRSVSKTLGPDLRLAVLAGDATTVSRVEGRMAVGPGWVSTLLQRLVVELWAAPGQPRFQATVAATYARRREVLISALAAQGLRAHGRSGFNVWVPVADESAAVAGLADAGFAVLAGERFRLASPPGVRITIATLEPAEAGRVAVAVAGAAGGGRGARLG